ncbi:unnamed protein product, partial [Candidula unifasciata]
MLASDDCMQFLHVWTLGLDGECYHPDSGVKIGLGGYKFVAIQLHWNNPDAASGLTDASGMVLHYTPNLTCASGCTQRDMVGPIHVTFAWNHMHYA